MRNFEYYSPTKIIFGKDTHKQVGEEVKKYANKILLHYGGGSVKKSGLYDQVVNSLNEAGVEFIELGGVQSNPKLGLVYKGIELCKENNIELILAVGGGSVIDSAKGIGMGVKYDGDVWDIYNSHKTIINEPSLPIATILTIPAAGSETSPNTVLTNEKTLIKTGAMSKYVRPVFSIMNPELCYTLPKYQMACGVSDMLAHTMERYFTNTEAVDYSDRLLEASMKSIINMGPKLVDNMQDYDTWANIMWAASMVHNGILGMGREEDWASHDIEHQLSAVYNIAHGAGLSIIFPAWMKYVYKQNINKFIQFAVRVWDVDLSYENPEDIISECILRAESFYKKIGLPIRLSEIDIDGREFKAMAKRVTEFSTVGNFKKLEEEDIVEIYKLALK